MKRNKFSLSHYKILTCDMGELVPLTWYEALPGDAIQQSTGLLMRASPLLAPVMHPVRIRLHHWFVPYRLIWADWENFITGGEDGTFTATYPHFKKATVAEGTLHDYCGVPPASYGVGSEIYFSALPARAYQLIYNEHYRDQDLIAKAALSTASGEDSTTAETLQKVSWEKDYFTTARPWELKGDEVTIPLGAAAPVRGIGKHQADPAFALTDQAVYETGGNAVFAKAAEVNPGANTTKLYIEEDPAHAGLPGIYADLASATGISINALKLALALQRYQEARAQYGSRYVEYLRYLGVRSSDARLQRPEYLGGGRQVMQFSEVVQTAPGTDPVGSMKGHGIAAAKSRRWRRYFEEHGIVMTLMSAVPKAVYSDGLHRSFKREVKEAYHQRELEGIGEQEVLNEEVYALHAAPTGTFGFQRRYDEYRWLPSSIAGEFRTTLDHWHLCRLFGSDPALNSTFINAVPSKRIFASESTDCLYVMASHSIQARRMIGMRATSLAL